MALPLWRRTTAKASPDMSHDCTTSCCSSQKSFSPAASHERRSPAHSENSRRAASAHSSACSAVMPSTLASTRGRGTTPVPTTLVRTVRTAPVAIGAPM